MMLGSLVESSDNFVPIFHPVEEWMIEYDITIPGFLEEDTLDPRLAEFPDIFESVIDHETYPDFFTDSRLRDSISGKMVHKVNIVFLDKWKVNSHPLECSLEFPRFVIATSGDHRNIFPMTIEGMDSFTRTRDKWDSRWING